MYYGKNYIPVFVLRIIIYEDADLISNWFSISVVPTAGGFVKILERNYPGLVEKIYIINGKFTYIVW